jgi:hypothetical protein
MPTVSSPYPYGLFLKYAFWYHSIKAKVFPVFSFHQVLLFFLHFPILSTIYKILFLLGPQAFRSFFQFLLIVVQGRDSAVGTATDYGLDDRGVGVPVPVASRIFISRYVPDRHWGPPNLLFDVYRGLFPPEVKGPKHEADQSPATSAEVHSPGTPS